MAADGSVVLDVGMDVKDADRELANLKRKIQNLERSIATDNTTKDRLTESARSIGAALDEAKAKLQEMKDAGKGVFAKEEITDQQDRVRMLQAEYNRVDGSLESINRKIERSNDALTVSQNEAGELQQHIAAAGDSTGETREQTASMGEAISSAYGKASQVIGIFKKVLSGVMKKTQALTKSILSLFKTNNRSTKSFGGSIKTMLKYGLGIRSLYTLFNRLRTAMTDGIKNLAQYSKEVNGNLSTLKSSLSQLKNTFATAFAPILTAVAPILNHFIKLVTMAADALARLLAMLSGRTTYTRAIAVQEDYAKSLENTGGAAEDAAKALANFDEINILATKNAGGGGGGGGADPSLMFEEVPVNPLKFDSWGEGFSAFLDFMLDKGIPALKKGLLNLADWINDLAANINEALTFPGVQDKVKKLGSSLGEIVNDFVNRLHWDEIGKAIGNGINTAVNFALAFVREVQWENIGAKLAELFNSAVETINWQDIGELLCTKFKIVFGVLKGFILNVEPAELATALGDMIVGALNSIADIIKPEVDTSIADKFNDPIIANAYLTQADEARPEKNSKLRNKLKQLGKELGKAFNNIVQNINWKDLGAGIGDIVGSLIDGMFEFTQTADFEEFGAKMQEAASEAAKRIDWEHVGSLLTAGLKGMMNFAFGGLKNMSEDDKKKMGENISDLIVGAINGVTDILATTDTSNIGSSLVTLVTSLNWGDIFTAILKNVVASIASSTNFLLGILEGLWDLLSNGVEKSGEEWDKLGGSFKDKLLEAIKKSFSDIKNWVKEHIVQPIIDGFKAGFGINSPSTVMEENGEYIVEGLENGVKGKIDGVLQKFTDLKDKIKRKFENLTNWFKGDFSTDWAGSWDGVSESFKDVWNKIVGYLESAINWCISGINKLLESVNSVASKLPGGIGDKVSIPLIQPVELPRLAQGAVIPPNREFMAVLGDQKSGTNIEAPLDTIVDAFMLALSRSGIGGEGGQVIENVVNLDGEVLYRNQQKVQRRHGLSMVRS